MKTLAAALFAIVSMQSAQAAIHKVELRKENGEVNVLVNVDVCPRGYPSVVAKATRIAADSALVEFEVIGRSCGDANQAIGFWVPLRHDLEALGLDPQTAKIFVELN